MSAGIRLVASDIDGTLLRDGETALPAALRDAIFKLQTHGVAFTVATGRLPFEVDPLLSGLPEQVPYVAGNGSVLKRGDTLLRDETFAPAPLRALAEYYAARGVTVIFSENGLERPLAFTDWAIANAGRFPGLSMQADEGVWQRPIRRMYFYHPEGWFLPECLTRLQAFPSVAEACLQNRKSIQLSAPGCTKASGLEALCGLTGIPRQAVLCIGDSFNDEPMLQWAGAAAVVGNACKELRHEGRLAAKAPYADGVLEILRAVFPDILSPSVY